ncbi:MAG: DUF3617 domain-containing protein [Thermoanaerobaculia bacterium]
MSRGKVFRAGALVSVGAVLLLTAAGAAGALRPGEYEMTTQASIVGMDHPMAPKTSRHCITAEDVKDSQRMATRGNEGCQVVDVKTTANRLSWTATCPQYKSKGTGEIVYDGTDGYEMTMKMDAEGGPHGAMKMVFHTKAKRVGECAK